MLQPPELQPTGPAEGIELFLPDGKKCLEYLEKIRWANGGILLILRIKTHQKTHTIQKRRHRGTEIHVPKPRLREDLLSTHRHSVQQTETQTGRDVLHNLESTTQVDK